MFDKVYLINLKRRPDRLSAFRQCQDEKGWELPEPIIFEAIDGNKVGVPTYYAAGGGAWGCCRSHVAIIERCIMEDVNSVLILEDDATWKTSAWSQLTQFMAGLPSNWDQLMLGGQHLKSAQNLVPGRVKCAETHRTHAYAIRGKAMKDLLNLWYKCNTHIDHVMGPWQSNWKVFAPDPFIFGQRAGRSDISGNRDNARFWTPPSTSASVVHLTAPRKIAEELRKHGLHFGYMIDRATGYDSGLVALSIHNNPAGHGLRKWLDTVMWEAASEENVMATVWHPSITVDMIRKVFSGPIIQVNGNTVESCLLQLQKPGHLISTTEKGNVIYLTAPRGVMEGLIDHGWHPGFWRDEITGQDNGLRKIAMLAGEERKGQLQSWVSDLSAEVVKIKDGIICVWNPQITVEELKEAVSEKIIEVTAHSIEEALAILKEKTS